MPIFTTAVSGSGTNRSQGLEHGGVASHFTGSIHIFSGSFPGQMGLNITGSALATDGVYTTGIHSWNFYGADAQVMSFNNGTTQVDFMGGIKVGGNIIKASDGGSTITMDTSDNVTIAGDVTVGGGDLIFSKDQNATIDIEDVSGTNIAGKSLTVHGGAGTGQGAGGQIDFKVAPAAGASGASVNSHSTILTLAQTGVATFAGSVQIPSGDSIRNGDGENVITIDADQNVTIGNNLKIAGNVIQAADGGSTITMDTNDNVTIAGKMLVQGDITVGDDAAIGYTAADGIIITGQGSTADVTIKNDAGNTALDIKTGTVQVDIGGDLQVGGNNIKDSAGNTQITFAAGSKTTFGYDIETTGTGSVAMLQVGTSLGNPIGSNNKGYPLRVSNDSTQDGSKSGIIVDTRDTDTIGAYAFEKQGNVGSGNGSRRGWYFDWSETNQSQFGWRNSESTENKDSPFTINTNTGRPGIRVGGGAPADTNDWVYGILVTGSSNSNPSQIKIRSHHGNGFVNAGGVPMLSWQYELNSSTANAGFWTMGVSSLGKKYNQSTANALTINAPSPGTSVPTANYRAVTILKGGASTSIGIGGMNATTTNAYGQNRAQSPTGSLHIEHQLGNALGLTQDLSKAQLLIGNSDNSTGEVTAGIHFDVSRESNKEFHTANILVANNDTADGHTGTMLFSLYDGSGNKDSTRPRLRIDDQGAAIFLSGTSPSAGGGWPQPEKAIYDISALDVPSGSITCISLMDGTAGKDPATINLISWPTTSTSHGTISAGDNLGRLAWWSADTSIDAAGEQYQQTAAYIEAIASAAHTSTNFAVGQLDFYARGAEETHPRKVMTLTGDATTKASFTGDVQVGSNVIRASDGGSTITLDTSDNVTIGNNLQVGGNIIKASDGGSTITMDTSDNVTIGNDLTVGGNVIRASDGGATITMDTSDNVTIGGALQTDTLQTATISYTDGDSAITIADGGFTKHTVGAQNAGGIMVSDDESAGDNEWCKFAIATLSSDSAEGTFIVNMGGAMAGSFIKSSTYTIYAKISDNSADNLILTAEPLSRGLDGSTSGDDTWNPATDLAVTWTDNVAELWIKTTVSNVGCTVTAVSGASITQTRLTAWTIPIGGDQEGWVAAIDDLGTINYGTWADKIFNKIETGTITSQGGTTPLTIDGHRNYMQWQMTLSTSDDQTEKIVVSTPGSGDVTKSTLAHPTQWRYCWTAPADGYIELVEAVPSYNIGKAAFLINSDIKWYKVDNATITDVSALSSFGSDGAAMGYYNVSSSSRAGKPTTFDFGSGTAFSAGDRIWMSFTAGSDDFYDETGGAISATNYILFTIIYVLTESALTT